MTLAIIGSRTWKDREAIRKCVSHLSEGDVVVSGGADGADTMGEQAASEHGLRVVSFRPRKGGGGYVVDRYEFVDGSATAVELPIVYPTFPAAAYARNQMIVDTADRGCAFWDGKSHGTEDTIKKFKKAGKPCRVFTQ